MLFDTHSLLIMHKHVLEARGTILDHTAGVSKKSEGDTTAGLQMLRIIDGIGLKNKDKKAASPPQ